MKRRTAFKKSATSGIALLVTLFLTGTMGITAVNAQATLRISGVATSSVTSTSATITWTTNLQADSQVDYSIDGSDVVTSTPLDPTLVTSHTVVLQGLTPSSNYLFRATSRDAQGRSAATGAFSFTTAAAGGTGGTGGGGGTGGTSDTTRPTVSVTAPTANTTVAGAVTVAASASDSNGVAGVQFKIDGSNLGAEDTTAPYSVSLDTNTVSNGSHNLTAVARDSSGNTATSAAVGVIVSNSVPTASGFYVAPNGSSTGNGSVSNPWDLQTALLSTTVRPGDTIWLRGGVYTGGVRSRLTGTASAPIVVRQYPGERAIIDGNGAGKPALTVYGAYTYYWGFEVRNTDPRRVTTLRGSNPGSDWRKAGVNIYGDYVKLINLVIHDNSDGVGFWDESVNSEVYGCVIFNNGWKGSDRGHGHGIYIQNQSGTKSIRHVVTYGNFATGMKAYAQGAEASGVHFDGVIAVENGAPEARGGTTRNEGILIGTTDAPQRDMKILNSVVFNRIGTTGTGLRLGYNSTGVDVEASGNYVAAGKNLSLKDFAVATVRNNTFFVSSLANTAEMAAGQLPQNYEIGNNRYFDASAPRNGSRRPFGIDGVVSSSGGGALSFQEWSAAYGWDTTSTYQAGPLSGTHIIVQPNEYEEGRANIAIYNWNRSATVAVDVSELLPVGARYELRSVQDYLGAPVISGTYDGQPLQVPMTNLPVTGPFGYDFTPQSTAPEFGAFVLIMQ
jgi:hypothetical protein